MKQKEAEQQASGKKSKKQASVVPFNGFSGTAAKKEENKAENDQDEIGALKVSGEPGQ